SGGLEPYNYNILSISSSSSEVVSTNFELVNGNIRQTVALSAPATVTILLAVSGSAGGTIRHSVIAHLSDDALLLAAPNTISIRVTDSSITTTVTASWNNSVIGTIGHQFGVITPAAAAANLSLAAVSGEISLLASLGVAQTISAEVIASSDAILGIAPVTVTQIIEVFSIPEVPAAVTVTTYESVNNLITANASGRNGDFTYSISDTRFTINNNVVDFTATLTSPTVIDLTVEATDILFGDSITLLVSVHVVDPPELNFALINPRVTSLVGSPVKVGELFASGGYAQGGYQFAINPPHSEFEIVQSGGDTATLSLVAHIRETGDRVVTVELSDTHPNTANKFLTATIELIAHVEATTYFPADQLFTVAIYGGTAQFNFSIDDPRFELNVEPGQDQPGVDLVATITSPTLIALTIVASAKFYDSTATLVVEIDIVDPLPLSVNVNPLQTYFLGASVGAVAIVSVWGGYAPNGYSISFVPTENNNYFAINDDDINSSGAILSLTATVEEVKTLIATVVVNDIHPFNAAITQEITVNIITLLATEIPLIEAEIVSAGVTAIAIAADGLAATVTVTAGYVGVLASLAVTGGYLDGGDYQISTSGDNTVLQVGADRQISVVSEQNLEGSSVQTLQLTIGINDYYPDNEEDSKTLVLVVEVLPPDG
nr:hypothetical protein [Pseudomonadota bacterium]